MSAAAAASQDVLFETMVDRVLVDHPHRDHVDFLITSLNSPSISADDKAAAWATYMCQRQRTPDDLLPTLRHRIREVSDSTELIELLDVVVNSGFMKIEVVAVEQQTQHARRRSQEAEKAIRRDTVVAVAAFGVLIAATASTLEIPNPTNLPEQAASSIAATLSRIPIPNPRVLLPEVVVPMAFRAMRNATCTAARHLVNAVWQGE